MGTVLLACIGQTNSLVAPCHHRKKKLFLSKLLATTWDWKKKFWLQYYYCIRSIGTQIQKFWQSIPTEKTKWLWFFWLGKKITITTAKVKKKINLTEPLRKKIYFCFWLQYYCGAQDIEIFLLALDPIKKKLFLATCTEFGNNFHWYSTATEKELFVATVLLWCPGHRNYCSVLC